MLIWALLIIFFWAVVPGLITGWMLGERGCQERLRCAAVAAPRAAEFHQRGPGQRVELGARGLLVRVGRVHLRRA